MENLERKKTIALLLGLTLLLFYIYNRINPIQLRSIQLIAIGHIINILVYLVVRIISAVLCNSIAMGLNRNQVGWGIFGFILPPIALIIIYFLSIKETADKEQESRVITQNDQNKKIE